MEIGKSLKNVLCIGLLVILGGCGGSGGGGSDGAPPPENPPPPVVRSVGGVVYGLNGSLTVSLNGSTSEISANGPFAFAQQLAAGVAYQTAIVTQPAGRTCLIHNASGSVADSNVTSILISCRDVSQPEIPPPVTYTVGGMVFGISGAVTLTLNGSEVLTTDDFGAFRFTTELLNTQSYDVQVSTPPAGQTCEVNNGSDVINGANIFSVTVFCSDIPATYKVVTVVTGLSGSLTIALAGAESKIINADGSYAFNANLRTGDTYSVSIVSQPAGQTCTMYQNTGTIIGSDANLDVLCAATVVELPPVISHVWPAAIIGGHEVRISGSNLSNVTVSYAGVAIQPSYAGPHEVLFIAPQFPKGDYAISVENGVALTLANVKQGEPLSGITAIDNGGYHQCSIINGGDIVCWGSNYYGQLGNGLLPDSIVPVEVVGISNAVSVAAGASHTCAVLATGEVNCWGRNETGQLGNGTFLSTSLPGPVAGITNAVAVAAGTAHSCALLATGSVMCWGSGALGVVSPVTSTTAVAVTGINNATAITAGQYHSCARLSTGAVQCWGDNGVGQLGTGSYASSATPANVSGISDASAVVAGAEHTCATLDSGIVQCWGSNIEGQLGNGGTANSNAPVTVMLIAGIVSVAAGDDHSCALSGIGTMYCWGLNDNGQLGIGNTSNSTAPVLTEVFGATAISAGGNQSCALYSADDLRCWGANSWGNLGIGYTPYATTPVGAIDSVANIGAGIAHNCALDYTGAVHCWGNNEQNRLGTTEISQTRIPVTVAGISHATSISSGSTHNCVVVTNGTVRCWGEYYSGKLGGGNSLPTTTPVTVVGVSNAISVSAGYGHSCAVLNDGSVMCWGENGSGQLGDGTTVQYRSTATTVSGISNAVAVDVGTGQHTCAVLDTGAVKCWGYNGDGELGDGTLIDKTTPVTVAGISTAQAISVGTNHSCAKLSSGSIQCWGSNWMGQLGNGSTMHSSSRSTTPVTVTGITNAASISTGAFHSCAALNTGTLSCWGRNNQGQLGNGTLSNNATPVAVSGISTAQSVTAGNYHTCAVLEDGYAQCWGSNEHGLLTLPGGEGGVQMAPGMPVHYPL